MTRYYNGQKCCWARRLTRFWDAADVQRLSQKDSFSPYIIASPVSCRKRTLLCLKSHIVRMVSVKSKINVSKFTLSCLWLSSASFSVASSSMPPSSALIRQHWLKMNIKIGKSELCPGACNVHGFGAATASMVQDACDGLAGSLTHSLTHCLCSAASGIWEQQPTAAQALKDTRTHRYPTLTLLLYAYTFHEHNTKLGLKLLKYFLLLFI